MTYIIENGHEHDQVICNKPYNSNYSDKRLSWRNAGLRSNIRDRKNVPLKLRHKKIKGYSYDYHLVCVSCKQYLPRKLFENYAMCEQKKNTVGFNVRCRDCSVNQYEKHGYKLDGTVVCDFTEDVAYESSEENDISSDDSDDDDDCDYDSSSDNSDLENNDAYEIESIVGISGDGIYTDHKYLVKWKNHFDDENTWEPYDNIKNALSLFIV